MSQPRQKKLIYFRNGEKNKMTTTTKKETTKKETTKKETTKKENALQETRSENLQKINDFNKLFKSSLKAYNEKVKDQKITIDQRKGRAKEIYKACFDGFTGNETLKNVISYYETLSIVNNDLKADLKAKKLDKADDEFIFNDNLRKAVLYQLKGSNDFDKLFKNLYISYVNETGYFIEKMKEYFNIELTEKHITYLRLLMTNFDKERTCKDFIKVIVNIYKCVNDFAYGVKPALSTLASVEKMISIVPSNEIYDVVTIGDRTIKVPKDDMVKKYCDKYNIGYTKNSNTYALLKRLENKYIVIK